MADDDSPQETDAPTAPSLAPPSLAPPGLGLGRLRRRRRSSEPHVEDLPAPVPEDDAGPAIEPDPPDEPAADRPDEDPPPPVDFDPAPDLTGWAEDADDDVDDTHDAREFRVPGRVAAILVGLVVGALLVFATAGTQHACDSIDGTNGCGGVSVVLLLAILVVAVVAGALLLRMLKVAEPGSTSFLAVGLTTVVALLFFVKQLGEWWIVIVIPLVSVAMYLASHWVTETYGDASFTD